MMQETGKLAAQRDPGNAFCGQSTAFTASDVVKITCLAGAIREDCFHQVVASCASSWFFLVAVGGLAEKESGMVLRQTYPCVGHAYCSLHVVCLLHVDSCYSGTQLHNFRSGWE